jgi:hypothetical protein
MAHVLIVARDKSLPVKMGGLLSLTSDGILGGGLFGRDGLLGGGGERVLIGSVKELTDLVTERV